MKRVIFALAAALVLIGVLVGVGFYWQSKVDRFSHIHQEVLVTEPSRFIDARTKAVNQPETRASAAITIKEIRSRLKAYQEELPSLRMWVPGKYFEDVLPELEKLDQACRDWLIAEGHNPE